MRYPLKNSNPARGMAVILALAILSITLGLVYAVSRSSVTQWKGSIHTGASIRADSAAEMAVNVALENLSADPNWMPESDETAGTLASGEPFQLSVEPSEDGRGRVITATAQVLDTGKTIADQSLVVRLAKQRRDNFPNAAIMAFGNDTNQSSGSLIDEVLELLGLPNSTEAPSVFVGRGSIIVGNIRARGTIQVQQGAFVIGQSYVLGNIRQDGTGSTGYLAYRAAWGTEYSAEPLSTSAPSGPSSVTISNRTLGPSTANPMGVFYHNGTVTLGNNVTISGTLVVQGNLVIVGTGVRILALTHATNPESGTTVETSFPAIVADGSIQFSPTADVVRISGLVIASGDVVRFASPTVPLTGGLFGELLPIHPHDHSVSISDPDEDVFQTNNGPAIYIRGAIMANRVAFQTDTQLPFALVFDPGATDTTDAPGFFTWKAVAWGVEN